MAGTTKVTTKNLPKFDFEQKPSASKQRILDLEDRKKSAKPAEEITG